MKNFAFIIFILITSLVQAQTVINSDEMCKEFVKYYTDGKSFSDFQNEYFLANKKEISDHSMTQLEKSFKELPEHIQKGLNPSDVCAYSYQRTLVLNSLPSISITQTKVEMTAAPVAIVHAVNVMYKNQAPNSDMSDEYVSFLGQEKDFCGNIPKKVSAGNEQNCEGASVLGEPVKVIVNFSQEITARNITGDKYTPAQCKCLESKTKKFSPMDLKRRTSSAAKLNSMIIKSVGQKILNEYASNYENVSYYLNNKAPVLTGAKASKSDYGPFLCNKAEPIKNAVSKACKLTNVSAEEMGRRYDDIFSSFGDDVKSMDLGHKMAALGNDISNIKGFKRETFDKERFVLSPTTPQLPFADNLVTSLMGSPALNQYIKKEIEESRKTPLDAILKLISDQDKKADVNGVLKAIGLKHPGLNDFIKTQTSKEELTDTINAAMNLHPGLKILLNNRDFFLKVNPYGPKTEFADKHTILEDIENNKTDLAGYFQGQCDQFRENIAKAVCTPNKELLNNIGHQEADNLVSRNEILTTEERNDMDLLICKSKPKNIVNSVFNGLSVSDNTIGLSDYYDRKTKFNINDQTNPFSKAYLRKDDKKATEINAFIVKADHDVGFRRVVAPMSFEPDTHGMFSSRNITVGSGLMKSDASDAASLSKLSAAVTDPSAVEKNQGERTDKLLGSLNNAFNDETKNPTITTPNVTNATIPFAPSSPIIPSVTNAIDPVSTTSILSPSKDEISEKITKSGKTKTSEQTKNLINNISEDDAKTVLNKVEKNGPETTSQIIDENKKELKELQSKYEALEKKYAASYGSAPQFSNQSFIGNNNSNTGNEKNAGGEGFGTNPGSDNVGSAKFNVFETSADGSQKAAGNKSIVVGKNGETANGTRLDIIVNESVSSTGVIDAKSDPDEEIYSLLIKSDPDIRTLELLKTSGVIYRYELIENGKTIQKERKIAYSELGPKVRDLLDLKLAKRTYSIKMLTNELLALDFLAKKKTPVKR